MVFANQNKRDDRHPDFRGEALIVCPHCKKEIEFEMNAWGNQSKNGKKYINGLFRLPDTSSEYYQKKKEADRLEQEKYNKQQSGNYDPPF